MKILCVVPTRMTDLNPNCLDSIKGQSVHIDRLIVSCLNLRGGTTASRVSVVLNRALEQVDLSEFDYLLRVDCDTVLHPDFLLYHLAGLPDLVGTGGYAMLIKVKPFMELMGGKFNPISDDSYILFKFQVCGKKIVKVNDDFLETRVHAHSKKDQLFTGAIYYRAGFEPIHMLSFLLSKITTRKHPTRYACNNSEWRNNMWFLVAGYFIEAFRRSQKFDFAGRVWNYQVRRLVFGRKIRGGIAW